jgi:hypothetical protein
LKRLCEAKEEVARSNEALSAVVWDPFLTLMKEGKYEEAQQMLSDLPECATRMRMGMLFSMYEEKE